MASSIYATPSASLEPDAQLAAWMSIAVLAPGTASDVATRSSSVVARSSSNWVIASDFSGPSTIGRKGCGFPRGAGHARRPASGGRMMPLWLRIGIYTLAASAVPGTAAAGCVSCRAGGRNPGAQEGSVGAAVNRIVRIRRCWLWFRPWKKTEHVLHAGTGVVSLFGSAGRAAAVPPGNGAIAPGGSQYSRTRVGFLGWPGTGTIAQRDRRTHP